MRDDPIVEKVREAIRKWGEKPVRDRIEDMIARGVIDREGNVLLRMPSAPKKGRTKSSPESVKGKGKV